MDMDAGVSSAAPTACATRAAISHATEGAHPHATDAAMNTAKPSWKTRLRPCASANPPAGVAGGSSWWTKYLYSDSFHPTPYGHELLAEQVRTAVRNKRWD